jgi:hypothetical protein
MCKKINACMSKYGDYFRNMLDACFHWYKSSCICVCVCAFPSACIGVCVRARARIPVLMFMPVCIYSSYLYVCMYNMYVCIYVCTYV